MLTIRYNSSFLDNIAGNYGYDSNEPIDLEDVACLGFDIYAYI
jgi:hypothetical protein